MKNYEVTQTYWENGTDNYYYNTVEVEANNSDEAIQKACLEGLFDECGYEVEDYTISDVYDVVEIESERQYTYGIEISYSWGDCEDGLYGNFPTKEDAYKEMCVLAAKESYVQNEEFLDTYTCVVYFNAYAKEIDLHYNSDDTWCYYRIKELTEDK